MKKILLTITFILLTVSLLFLLKESKENSKILGGYLKETNLYEYNLNNDEGSLNGYSIIDNNIYSLIDKETKYELYYQNIYDKKSTKIGEIDNEGYCNLSNNYITCNTVDKSSIYDLELNLKYETDLSEEGLIYIIPYKDTFLKMVNNIIYLNQNNNDITFRTLEEKFKDYNFYKYYYERDNTFITFINFEANSYFIYNIKDNTYEEITLNNIYQYENGFLFSNEEIYKIYDLKNNKEKEYQNPFKNIDYQASTINQECNKLYLYDTVEKTFKIIDLESFTIEELKLNLTNDNEILELILKDNYLFIAAHNKKTTIYLYDLTGFSEESFAIDDYVNENKEKNEMLINDISNNYHINIHIGEETQINYPDFNAKATYDYRLINQALSKISLILNKLNSTFFDTFYNNNYKGLNVYLTGELTPSDYETQASDPSAYSLLFNNEYMIVINISSTPIEEVFCHELMHNIEFNIENKNTSPFPDWLKYNPKGFNYLGSYTKTSEQDFTIYDLNEDNVYFIDRYSHTFPAEDRARIFEKICAYDEKSIVNEYPNLKIKAEYLKENILNNFPMLNESTIFNSMN
ncbi:MAG: hypothetical protein NC483_05195 [Ruminococcus sp.]|nr:hypothetical protein [Ruminococcus sp.]